MVFQNKLRTFMTLQGATFIPALIILCSCGNDSINNTHTTQNNNTDSDSSAISLMHTIFAKVDIDEKYTNDSIDIDSLLSILHSLQPFGTTIESDTSRIITLNQLSVGYEITHNYDSALHYAYEAYNLLSDNSDRLPKSAIDEMFKGKANALYNIGIIHENTGNYLLAMDFYIKSIAIWEKLGGNKGFAESNNRIENVHKDRGNYHLVMDYYQKSLTIRKQLCYKLIMSYLFNCIGWLALKEEDYAKAIAYSKQGLALANEIGAWPLEKYSYQIIEETLYEYRNNVYIVYFQEFSIIINELPLDSLPLDSLKNEYYHEYYQNIQEVHDDTAWIFFGLEGNAGVQTIIITKYYIA